MSRATASSRIDGNLIALQFDGPTTFDTWLEAIRKARSYVHFENYILRDDDVGREFRDALTERARAGVQVRVLYDWVGCWATPRRYWRPFRAAGVAVRAFNPPSVGDPLGVFQRGHRKLVVVDGEVAYIGGFCVGQEWAGTDVDPPWRDTGVEIRGPAAAHAAQAFERSWTETGAKIPPELRADPANTPIRGNSKVWLIEGRPWRSRVYRATQLMASWARHRLWITDPYFLAPRPVSEALMAAARDGVDVRILVPAHNNWPWVGSLSRGGFRSLLMAGVRLFEWQGPMIHAKTSVVDGRWCRIGSTNLNSASLLGNWELDVGVLDEDLASQVQALFFADLASAVEIVLPNHLSARPRELGEPGLGTTPLDGEHTFTGPKGWHRAGGQTLTIADLVRAGSALGDAIAGQRVLGREDRVTLWTAVIILLAVAALAAFFPRAVGWVLAVGFGWIGLTLAVRSAVQARRARREKEAGPED
ncbi:MAG: phospholipase D-like domain-containing protein [Gemmatimonadota bacterium]